MRWYLNYIVALVLLLTTIDVSGQTDIDSLKELLKHHPQEDTVRVNWLNELTWRSYFAFEQRLPFADIVRLADKLHYVKGEVIALCHWGMTSAMPDKKVLTDSALGMAEKSGDKAVLSYALTAAHYTNLWSPTPIDEIPLLQRALDLARASGDSDMVEHAQSVFGSYVNDFKEDFAGALDHYLDALAIAEKKKPDIFLGTLLESIGELYSITGDSARSLQYLQQAFGLARALRYKQLASAYQEDIGDIYLQEKEYSLALPYFLSALGQQTDQQEITTTEYSIADIYSRTGKDKEALTYGEDALGRLRQINDTLNMGGFGSILSRAYLHLGRIDSALDYAQWGYDRSVRIKSLRGQEYNAEELADAYRVKKDYAHALKYYTLFIADRDSALNQEAVKKTQARQFKYDLEKKQAQVDLLYTDNQLRQEQSRRQRTALIAALGGLVLIGALLFVLARNNRQRRKAYTLLQKQKQEIQDQRDQTAQALRELRTTQAQLIQSEKMASLGELTAGVAHEIQNPLNFVNNFSDVSIELLAELMAGPLQSLTGPAREEADMVIRDISDNLAKIAAHGRRAESIVKGMLMHARASTGTKELTDLNALVDECLRLSYQGFRAKDKSFNATFNVDLDPAVGRIDVIPQDLSRVLVNVVTNALYSMGQKGWVMGAEYKPILSLTTKRVAGDSGPEVVIIIRDNGMGIPARVAEKIYQPFFTTKPTGEGTGLGLSMSYDIITRGHGGTLEVDTKEGEYAEFTIRLPG